MGNLFSKKIPIGQKIIDQTRSSPKIFPAVTHKIEKPDYSGMIYTEFILNYALYDDEQTPIHSKRL